MTASAAPAAAPSRRSALVAGLIVVALVAVMVNLGFWQLRRHAEVAEQNEQILARSSTPVPIAEVDLARPVDEWDFQLVELEGRWTPEDEVLWRGRNRNGVPGFEILTPFTLDADGMTDPTSSFSTAAILVDRGFLPDTVEPVVPVVVAPPPAGPVTLTGILRPSVDQPGFGPRDPEEGELAVVFHADVSRIDRQTEQALVPMAYLRLVSADPATQSEVLRPLEPIEPDAGNHFGYALQWFGFSATAVVAYLAWLRSRVLRRTRDTVDA